METKYKDKLIDFYSRERRMPTYSEMMKIFGFKSKNAVARIVAKLEDAGFITKDPSGHIMPTSTLTEVPILGLVKAGFPAQAEELFENTINLNDFLIKNKPSTYLLEVDGDSMIEAHIADGDLVIAERTENAKDGDIVVAQVDGEFTMKFYKQKGSKVWLEPANKNFKPIYPENDLKICAIIRGVIRKF